MKPFFFLNSRAKLLTKCKQSYTNGDITQTLIFYDYFKKNKFSLHCNYFKNFKKDVTTNSCE